jgi:hypothetical protein
MDRHRLKPTPDKKNPLMKIHKITGQRRQARPPRVARRVLRENPSAQ